MRKYFSISFMVILLFFVAITSSEQGNTAPAPNYFAYVANSGGDNNISAYSIDPTTGALTEIKGSPFPAGIHPISMAVHPNGNFIYAVNYESHNISAYSINALTGALSQIKGSPFAINTGAPDLLKIAPSGNFLYTANLNGYISIYAVNPKTGILTAIKDSPFHIQKKISGMAFDPTGKFALTTDYLHNSIISYSINDETGRLTKIKETPIKSGKNPNSITIDPTGRFALVYKRDSFNLSTFNINTKTGVLTGIKGSSFIAGRLIDLVFALTGKFVYALRYEAIDAYYFDPTVGKLTDIINGGYDGFSDSHYPTSLTVDPNHRFLYVTNSRMNLDPNSFNAIYVFSINPTTGRLTEIKGSPFATHDHPGQIVIVKK